MCRLQTVVCAQVNADIAEWAVIGEQEASGGAAWRQHWHGLIIKQLVAYLTCT
jgi:hypothetical protein